MLRCRRREGGSLRRHQQISQCDEGRGQTDSVLHAHGTPKALVERFRASSSDIGQSAAIDEPPQVRLFDRDEPPLNASFRTVSPPLRSAGRSTSSSASAICLLWVNNGTNRRTARFAFIDVSDNASSRQRAAVRSANLLPLDLKQPIQSRRGRDVRYWSWPCQNTLFHRRRMTLFHAAVVRSSGDPYINVAYFVGLREGRALSKSSAPSRACTKRQPSTQTSRFTRSAHGQVHTACIGRSSRWLIYGAGRGRLAGTVQQLSYI